MENSNASFPIVTILGLIFIVLKLTHLINWSWWYVLIPFYAIPVIFIVFILFAFTIGFIKNRKEN